MDELQRGETAPHIDAPVEPKRRGLASEIFRFALMIIAITLLARAFISPFEVDGQSMTPNLHDHDRVFVSRARYLHFNLNRWINLLPGEDRQGTDIWYPFNQPQRGDIVVLDPPTQSDKPFIKRVIGLPGETVTFHNGYVYIDGVRLDESYINGPITNCDRQAYCNIGPIPEGYVFVLGDHRDNSEDSRYFGPVAIDQLIGEAWFTNWPMDVIGRIPSADYPSIPAK
jgi:signal peptidase I